LTKRAAAVLLRLAIIIVGFVAACLVAAGAMWGGALLRTLLAGLPVRLDPAVGRDMFALVFIYTLVPAIVLVALAEWEGWRRWSAYTVAGALMPMPAAVPILINTRMPEGALVFAAQLPIAGALGGLAYWLVAGCRRATKA